MDGCSSARHWSCPNHLQPDNGPVSDRLAITLNPGPIITPWPAPSVQFESIQDRNVRRLESYYVKTDSTRRGDTLVLFYKDIEARNRQN